MPHTITQDGEELVWIAKYWRHHGQYEEECDSLEEAVRFLESGEDYGELSSDSIAGPDGRVIFDFSGSLNIWEVAERLEGEGAQAEPDAPTELPPSSA